MKINFSKIFTTIAGLIAIVIIVFFFSQSKSPKNPEDNTQKDYKSLTYIIENQPVSLINGYAETEAAPGSASKIVTKIFGNEAKGDLNGDGSEDVAFLITQDPGGTGDFYYIAVVINSDKKYTPTNTIFLGDRIAPQTTEINDGIITVNYADRKPGEPMTTAPSVGVSKYFKIEDGLLTEKSIDPAFGMPQEFSINKSIQFGSEISVTLKEINDSRCKLGVICIWAGELSPLFIVTGNGVGNIQQEIRLGTTNNKKVSRNGYIFELKEATETLATIIITKEATVAEGCYIGGCSSEICSNQKDIVSTCIYKPQFDCYKTAVCEKQESGKCGWTPSVALTACLNR